MSRRPLGEVIETEGSRLMGISGVVGVAEGVEDGEPCVVVYALEVARKAVPEEIDGYPVVVRDSGEIRAQ